MLNVFITVDTEIWCNGWSSLDHNFPDYFKKYIYGPTVKGNFALPETLKILNDYNKINIIVNVSVCDIQDINLDKIFNSIENLYTNNFTDSIDKVNLLYIRDNVAHKKNE